MNKHAGTAKKTQDDGMARGTKMNTDRTKVSNRLAHLLAAEADYLTEAGWVPMVTVGDSVDPVTVKIRTGVVRWKMPSGTTVLQEHAVRMQRERDEILLANA